jgi:hypothetical protein
MDVNEVRSQKITSKLNSRQKYHIFAPATAKYCKFPRDYFKMTLNTAKITTITVKIFCLD